MSMYITTGNFTAVGIQGMLSSPEDRREPLEAVMKAVGGRLVDYYFTTGENDFLIISEHDESDGFLVAALLAAASGSVTNLKTVQALTTVQAQHAMERASSIRGAYRPPGKAP